MQPYLGVAIIAVIVINLIIVKGPAPATSQKTGFTSHTCVCVIYCGASLLLFSCVVDMCVAS